MKSLAEKISIGIGGFLSLVSVALSVWFMIVHNFPVRYDEVYPAEMLYYIAYFIVPSVLLLIYFVFRVFSKILPTVLIRYTVIFCFSSVFMRLANRMMVHFYRVLRNQSIVESYKMQFIAAAVAVVAIAVVFAVNFKKRYSLVIGVIAAVFYAAAGSYSMIEVYEPANELFFCGYVCQALALLFVYMAAFCSNKRVREVYAPVFGDIGKGGPQPSGDSSDSTVPVEKSVDREVVSEPQPPKEAKRFCSHCGNKLDGDENFCQYCGNKVV